jgi:type I restriction enzyme S subunit
MSKIDELISRYCPSGVEKKSLETIGFLYGGLSGKGKSDFQDGNAKYISYKNIYSNIAVDTNAQDLVKISEGEKQNEIKLGDVLFTGSSESKEECGMSSVLLEDYDGKLYLNSFSLGFRLHDRSLFLPGFLKYLFRDNKIRKQIIGTASGVTRYNISKKRFGKITIPIPPLIIQEEIVNILDKFTLLMVELEAELEARSRQYVYYRNKLLTFANTNIEWKYLGEVGTFTRGRRFVRTDMTGVGFPCIHYGEMYTHYNVYADKSKSFINKELAAKLRKANPGDVIIVAAGETIEDIGKGTAWLGDTDVVTHDACFSFKSSLNPKYVSYFLRTRLFHDQIRPHISSGKISAINAKGLGKAKIPIPPKAEQDRIVAILDNFDALVNNISTGLPAEIKARKQQYEYYRGKLLTFF